ncbi:hydrogenase maturation protease [Clostridium saccharoperbutylacetonicum]|uniref:Hydrogenase maturation protease n=1 Tax=Clostridium saccharoperbutylacetonicum N1-4(HMT) TaxID=931276 RepID=M1LX66_9CLOT|nr:HyaD/HybD family hydrogenase maturation endopeptidase [Clostridium saccharoperbutylacetonicum]AGF57830.1 hydrogenase maturation protease [Clostridium saccharoperbutylacetonicum N1-4(HMT)]NRT61398.1 hydrogenase maturation protease [Clostridium saccharoperbutylacetonicum]NSB24716.1 hydrogenase maturation protease [Clostridium saccharoperbutylacetonicum]NSB44090.1 hydrogenase maturation protease [Clostridium saccharoperbutylacetonicum]
MNSTVIIGIGNILLKDDGVGVCVIRQLEKENLPSTIELVDGGTSTLDTLSYFLEYNKVIIIDCLKAGYKPGTIYKINPEDINGYKKENLSIHDVQILDVVQMANMLGKFPKVVIFGIEPEEICLDTEITETMKNKIPEIIKHIKAELNMKEDELNIG